MARQKPRLFDTAAKSPKKNKRDRPKKAEPGRKGQKKRMAKKGGRMRKTRADGRAVKVTQDGKIQFLVLVKEAGPWLLCRTKRGQEIIHIRTKDAEITEAKR